MTATIDEGAGTYSAADVPLGEGTNTVTAEATDLVGNVGTATATIVLDTIKPTISDISASGITSAGATITWTTDELATSEVEYGISEAYGQVESDATLTTSHSITLTGLSAETTYHYRVKSADAATNLSVSADHTFTTEAAYVPPTPDFSISVSPTSGSVVHGGSTTATVSINSIAGFSETVSLPVSGLPSGVTASFTPSSGTPSFDSTLTISTSGDTPTGTYSITITGTGGGKTHSCTYILTVTATVPIPPEIIQVESPPVHIPEITPGIPQDISIENTDIIGMTINVSESVENVQIIVQQLTERPATIEIAAPGITYLYFNIVVENMPDAQIENVIINFKVEKSWIAQNTIDMSTITLNRYDPVAGEWTSLPATYLSEDDTYVYFSAVSPGLSVFAVSGTTVVPPAEFEVSNLLISPEKVEPGETVTVSAKVTNVGGQSGSYEVEFYVEGTLEDTETVTLSPDGSTTVTFTTSREEEGTYGVEVDGLIGSFEVKKPAIFPWPIVVAIIIIVIAVVGIWYLKRGEISRRLRKV